MSTSDSNRLLKMAAGIALVFAVVGGALYLGGLKSGEPTAGAPGSEPAERTTPADRPTFEVTPHDASLGESGVEAGSGGSKDEPRAVTTTVGPSDLMLRMVEEPNVTPAAARRSVESLVQGLTSQLDACWKGEERAATWYLVVKVGEGGTVDLTGSRLKGIQSDELHGCLKKAAGGAAFGSLDPGVSAMWPIGLDPKQGVLIP